MAKVEAPKECKYNDHDYFQLTTYSIGQHTLGMAVHAASTMAKIACRKCGKIIAV